MITFVHWNNCFRSKLLIFISSIQLPALDNSSICGSSLARDKSFLHASLTWFVTFIKLVARKTPSEATKHAEGMLSFLFVINVCPNFLVITKLWTEFEFWMSNLIFKDSISILNSALLTVAVWSSVTTKKEFALIIRLEVKMDVLLWLVRISWAEFTCTGLAK